MHAFARVTVCVWGGGCGRHEAGGGAPLSGEGGGGICPKCPPYGDATGITVSKGSTTHSCMV